MSEVRTETTLRIDWPNEADDYIPRYVADELDLTKREAALIREVLRLREMIENESSRREMVDEQLDFARETISKVADLNDRSPHMRAVELRLGLLRTMSENMADF